LPLQIWITQAVPYAAFKTPIAVIHPTLLFYSRNVYSNFNFLILHRSWKNCCSMLTIPTWTLFTNLCVRKYFNFQCFTIPVQSLWNVQIFQ
jgi:hypothetical protein